MSVLSDQARETENGARIGRKAAEVHRLLVQQYGPDLHKPQRDPLSTLVLTILTQHTSDVNAGRAFETLVNAFGSWEAVRDAGEAQIADAIRSAGLANIKSRRIKKVLQRIAELRGELTLDFLDGFSTDEAKSWLRDLDGVGPKTAACVLLFSLGKPAMPVDTHVYRVGGRLGLIQPKVSVEAAHEILERLVPPEDVYTFHTGLILHGRRICRSQHPRCGECVLYPWCDNPVSLPRHDAPMMRP